MEFGILYHHIGMISIPWSQLFVFVSCYCSCCIAYVLRHLVPMCGAFVFKCKLLICTHVGGVPLSFVNMVVLTSDIIANPYVVIKHQKGGD